MGLYEGREGVSGYKLILVQSIGDVLPALCLVESKGMGDRCHLVFLNIPDELLTILKFKLPNNCSLENYCYPQITFLKPVSAFQIRSRVDNFAKKHAGAISTYYFSNNYDWFTSRLIMLLSKKDGYIGTYIYPHFDTLAPTGKGGASFKQKILALLWSYFTGVKCQAVNRVRFMRFQLESTIIASHEINSSVVLKKYQIKTNGYAKKSILIFADTEEWSYFRDPSKIFYKILHLHRDDNVFVKAHPKHSIPSFFLSKRVEILNNKIPIEFYSLDNVVRVYGLITSALITFQGVEKCKRISLLNYVESNIQGLKHFYSNYLNNSSQNILFNYE